MPGAALVVVVIGGIFLSKIIVFANQKGGVGKTTSVINIGSCLAAAGKRVLLIDFDPQSNLSSGMGADKSRINIYNLLSGQAGFDQSLQKSRQEGLFFIASSVDLSAVNIELAAAAERENYLAELLKQQKQNWDYILIDSPPSLGLLTINGLTASDHIVVPLQCEYFALEGLSQLLKTIKMVQSRYNECLTLLGIIFTMYDSRTRLANEVVNQVSSFFKQKVFKTIIPRNIRLSEAPSHGMPINLYDQECVGARSYQKLAQEVAARV